MIKSLTIKNFRAYESAELALDKLNWIVGDTEQGKSSIPLALEFALQRKNEYITDDRGKGVEWLKKTGTKKSVVSCVTDSGEYFQNTIPSAAKEDNSADYDSELVKVCLRCRYILHMPDREQKEFFQNLLLGPITPEVILKELNVFDDEFPDLGEKFISSIPEGMHDDIDSLLVFAIAKRKDINAKYEAVKTWIAPQKPEVSRNTTEKEVAKARKQIEEALKKVTQEEESLKHHKHLVERDLRDWETLRIIAEKRQIELTAAEKEVAAAKNQKNGTDYTKALQKNQAELKKINTEIQTLQHKIDSLTGDDPCPGGTCARVDLKHYNNTMKDWQGKKSTLVAQSQDLIYRNNEAVQNNIKLQTAQARLDRAQKAIAEAEPLGPQPIVMEPDDTKLAQLRAQENMFRTTLDNMEKDFHNGEKCKEINDAIAKKSGELEELTSLKKMWEAIVKALGPHGIKTKLLQSSFAQFQSEVNEKLIFFGVKMQFNLDPWGMLVDTGKGHGYIPVQFLSPSAESKVSIGLQLVIAKVTNFPCIAIDEHRFGPMLRSKLFVFLLREDVQSIVISTLMEIDANRKLIIPKHPGNEGVKMFYVESGTVTDIKIVA